MTLSAASLPDLGAGPLPAPRENATAVYGGIGHALVIGGINGSGTHQSTVFSCDIATNARSTIVPQPTALENQAAVLGADGLDYILGGDQGTFGSDFDTVYTYDPRTGAWSIDPSLIRARRAAVVAFSDDEYIQVMSGRNGAIQACGGDSAGRINVEDWSSAIPHVAGIEDPASL